MRPEALDQRGLAQQEELYQRGLAAGHGVELDWPATFWDMRTEHSVTTQDILGCVRDTDEGAYTEINEQAQLESTAFKNAWNDESDYNGIDH